MEDFQKKYNRITYYNSFGFSIFAALVPIVIFPLMAITYLVLPKRVLRSRSLTSRVGMFQLNSKPTKLSTMQPVQNDTETSNFSALREWDYL